MNNNQKNKYIKNTKRYVTMLFVTILISILVIPVINVLQTNNIVLAEPSADSPRNTIYSHYVNVGSNWKFSKLHYEDETPDLIIATDGANNTAIFSFKQDDTRGRFLQKLDYYNNPNFNTCGAQIVISNVDVHRTGSGYSTDNYGYTLAEEACGDEPRKETIIEIGTTDWDVTTADEATKKQAENINWGNEPIGCTGFAALPSGSTANYNCPGGGAVIGGTYKAEPTAEDKAKLEPSATNIDCNAAENKEKPECTGANAGTSCTDVAGVFGWLICEAGDIADNMVEHLEDGLYNLLRVPELAYGSEVYNQWAIFRSLATSLLILVSLVAIAAQVFNLDIISAYTMRKIIPKILIAAILIFLSYYLAGLAITFVNALGDGVASLMMGPFDNGMLLTKTKSGDALEYILSGAQAGTKPTDTAALLATSGVLVGFLVAYMASGGVAILILGFMIPLFAAASAFIVLVIRKVLILGLVMIAPLAIVAWILPGTEKWFKSWWGMLSKLLFMYPLIIGIISLGRVGAYLISRTGDIENTSDATVAVAALESNARGGLTGGVLLLMTLIAFFAPYFFISSMFKTAGGAFAKISDGLSAKGRGYAKSSSDLAAKAANKGLAKKAANGGNGRLARAQIWNTNRKRSRQGLGPLTQDMERDIRDEYKRRSQKFYRGASYTAQGAVLPESFGGRSLRAAAVAKNDKAIQEEKQEIETLIDVKLRGLDETQVLEELKKIASGSNQDLAHAALAQMQKRNMNSDLGELFNSSTKARQHIISKQRADESYNAFIKANHRDMHEDGWNSDGSINLPKWQKNIQGMRKADVLALNGSAMKRIAKGMVDGSGAPISGTRLRDNDADELAVAMSDIAKSMSAWNSADPRTREALTNNGHPLTGKEGS